MLLLLSLRMEVLVSGSEWGPGHGERMQAVVFNEDCFLLVYMTCSYTSYGATHFMK